MSTLRLVIGVVVTIVWAAAWMTAIIRSDYTGVTAVTPVMLLVVGALFGGETIKMLKNGKVKND